jgi:hypothetical protein
LNAVAKDRLVDRRVAFFNGVSSRPDLAAQPLILRERNCSCSLTSLLHNRVVKRGDPPGTLILHEHSNAQFLVRWQRLPVGAGQPAQFIGDVRERNVWPDESHRHVERLERDVAARVSKILVSPFSISAVPFMDSPRTVTSCASGVQNVTHAFASWRLKVSVVAAIIALMESSSLRAPDDEVCAALSVAAKRPSTATPSTARLCWITHSSHRDITGEGVATPVMRANLEQLRDALIDDGYVTRSQLADDIAALDRADFVMPSSILWSVRGRRPSTS